MPGRRLSCRHAGKQANKGKRRPPCALASSLLALGLLLLTRELVGEVLRERLVLLELHGEGGTALVLFYFVVFVLLFVLCLLVLWRV